MSPNSYPATPPHLFVFVSRQPPRARAEIGTGFRKGRHVLQQASIVGHLLKRCVRSAFPNGRNQQSRGLTKMVLRMYVLTFSSIRSYFFLIPFIIVFGLISQCMVFMVKMFWFCYARYTPLLLCLNVRGKLSAAWGGGGGWGWRKIWELQASTTHMPISLSHSYLSIVSICPSINQYIYRPFPFDPKIILHDTWYTYKPQTAHAACKNDFRGTFRSHSQLSHMVSFHFH